MAKATKAAAGKSPKAQLDGFLGKFRPEVARMARAALARMRKLLPGAVELVYDNYNALAIAFGAGEKMADIVFSIAVYPRWVSLFFAQGRALADPKKLLKGSGTRVRHIVLTDPALLDSTGVRALMAQALENGAPIDAKARGRIVIKSISKTQRPRR